MHTISALCSSKVQWKSSSVAFIWVVSLQMQNKHLQFINYVNNECVDQPTINSFFFYWYTFYNYPVYIITNSTWSIKDDEDIISFIMFLSHPFSLFSWSSFVFLSPSNSALDFLQHDGNWLVVIYMLWLLCSWGKSSCCLYVCMYMYIYIYIMCVCVCVCKYVCVCEFMYVYLFVCMCVCVCIYVLCILLYRNLYTLVMFVPTSALKSTISVSYFDTGAGILFGWWWRTCAKIPFIETIIRVWYRHKCLPVSQEIIRRFRCHRPDILLKWVVLWLVCRRLRLETSAPDW